MSKPKLPFRCTWGRGLAYGVVCLMLGLSTLPLWLVALLVVSFSVIDYTNYERGLLTGIHAVVNKLDEELK
jgi:hypothetical protein